MTQSHSFLSCASKNITLEAMKRAEDESGMILRIVEHHNFNTTATLVFDHPLKKAWVCDLMENKEAEISTDGTHLNFDIKPYEIKTLSVCF